MSLIAYLKRSQRIICTRKVRSREPNNPPSLLSANAHLRSINTCLFLCIYTMTLVRICKRRTKSYEAQYFTRKVGRARAKSHTKHFACHAFDKLLSYTLPRNAPFFNQFRHATGAITLSETSVRVAS